MLSRRPKDAQRRVRLAPIGLKEAKRTPQDAQRRPKDLKFDPRSAPEASKGAQECTKSCQKAVQEHLGSTKANFGKSC